MLHVAQPCFTGQEFPAVSSANGGVHAAFKDAAGEAIFFELMHVQLYPTLMNSLAPGEMCVWKAGV